MTMISLKTSFLFLIVIAYFAQVRPDDDDCSVIGEVRFVQVFTVSDQLVAVWHEPENQALCNFENLEYYVTYSILDQNYTILTPNMRHYFTYEGSSCINSIVTITGTSAKTTSGVPHETMYNSVGSVSDITLTQSANTTTIAWQPPAEGCTLIYRLELEYSGGIQMYEISKSPLVLQNATIIPCENVRVTITPIYDEFIGIPIGKEFNGAVGPVTNFKLEKIHGEEVIARFDPPVGTDQCKLSYEVIETDYACFVSTVTVAAYTESEVFGEKTVGKVEAKIPRVSNLVASLPSNRVEISWTAPPNVTGCNVRYSVNFNSRTYTVTAVSTSLTATDSAVVLPCRFFDVVVSPLSASGVLGDSETVVLTTPLGPVRTLTVTRTSTVITVTWVAPLNSSSCSLTYLVNYVDNGVTYVQVTQSLSFTIFSSTCAEMTVTVEPYSANGVLGSNATTTLDAC